MKNLIYKELMLAMHPAAILFLCLSSMLMIPSYPYFIIFFYTCLGVFFICMSGRENKDIYYTMLLPAEKRGIVAARFLLVVLIELLQFAAAVPFALLRSAVYSGPNEAGMNVNPAFFGFAFLMLGLFNLVFFTKYYKNPNKVGVPFLLGCIAFSVCMLLVEASRFAVPLCGTLPERAGRGKPSLPGCRPRNRRGAVGAAHRGRIPQVREIVRGV